MTGLILEERELPDTKTLSWDIAHHILGRHSSGKIAVVTDKPTPLMSAARKQWLKIIRRKERERSSTLRHKYELTEELERLREVSFTARPPFDDLEADISFATVEQFLQAPPICHTLYITYSIERHEQYLLASWMPPRALVVVYAR